MRFIIFNTVKSVVSEFAETLEPACSMVNKERSQISDKKIQRIHSQIRWLKRLRWIISRKTQTQFRGRQKCRGTGIPARHFRVKKGAEGLLLLMKGTAFCGGAENAFVD